MSDSKSLSPRYCVATDIPGKSGKFWHSHTVFYKPVQLGKMCERIFGRKASRRLENMLTACRLFVAKKDTDAYITSGSLVGTTLALLQLFCFWNRKPHILIDCIWYVTPNCINNLVLSRVLRAICPAVTFFVVWAAHEIKDYSKTFGIDQRKIKYVHFWHTLLGYEFEKQDEGYVFAGGNWDRDYGTVLKVASRLPNITFRIGTTRPEQFNGYDVPENVIIKGYTPEGFRQAIASCSVMLVPMVKGVLHSGGQQTVLNAMCLGKPTIAFGHRWAVDLIEDKHNGFIVEYEEVDGVVDIIRMLWDDPVLYSEVASSAAIEGAAWPPSRSLEVIYRMVLGVPAEEELLTRSCTEKT